MAAMPDPVPDQVPDRVPDPVSGPVLETARLILRRIEPGDAERQYRLLNTPAMMDHLGGPKSLDQIRERLDKSQRLFAERGFGFLFLVEKASGEMVGHCGIKLVDNPLAHNLGDLEVGWAVREDRWRRGYAYEAMRAVLNWAFAVHGAPHVVALTATRNEASWRLMEKLGMRRAPELDFDDPAYPPQDNPTILYRILRSAWEAGR